MRPSAYDFPGLREQFQYYDDGRLKQMTDLDDRNQDIGFPDTARHFSRARSYDQAGRLTSDKGATSSTFPLNQTYAYDEFNNPKSRYGTYYYQNQTSDTASYTNNRRQNWTYHADGQVKHSPLAYDVNFNESVYRDWSYDAAGQMVQVQETVTSPSSVSTYTTSYDGDGQPVRESTSTATFTTTAYMIRSSVLDEVVTRLDSAGNKTKTVVNVDGMLMAVQLSIGGSNSVSWTHIDPLGLSEAGDTKPVYDALGNYVPWQHVPSGAPPNAYPPFSPNYGGLGGGFGSTQSTACTDNGMPMNCNTAMRLVNNGSAVIGSIISNQQPANFFASLGIAVALDVSTERVRHENPVPGRPRTPPRLWPPGTRPRTPDPGPGGDGEGGPGTTYSDVTTISYRLVSAVLSVGLPQNPVPFDIPGIRSGLQDALNRPGCREFVQSLLDAVQSKKNPLAKNGDIMALFESVVSGTGGFTRTAPPGSAGYGNPLGQISKNNAGIFLFASPKHSPGLNLIFDTYGAFHELMHLAGSNRYYSDKQFAEAVHGNSAYMSRNPYPGDKDYPLKEEAKSTGAIGWGAYWGDLLKQKCFGGN